VDTLEHVEVHALLGEASEKAADGVRCLAHGRRNLRSAGAFVAAQHRDDVSLLGIALRGVG
jgi:hypothetical protein